MSHMLEVGDGDPWGREGPPEEAYSRVTRDLATIYAPLAPAAHEAVQRLLAEYDVTAYDVLASEQERFPRTTEAVALVPGDSRTATLRTTDLPGLTVRVGNSEAHAVHHWIGIKRNP